MFISHQNYSYWCCAEVCSPVVKCFPPVKLRSVPIYGELGLGSNVASEMASSCLYSWRKSSEKSKLVLKTNDVALSLRDIHVLCENPHDKNIRITREEKKTVPSA